ncbi:MAG: DNA gyrase modulator, partial [Actinomycetota bacterium]|nr:DNA gyrase modulator [Actinomycetota bacterium]
MEAQMKDRIARAEIGPMVDPQLLQDVLGEALATGGEFAEVFVEDRRSTSALLDDGRIEEMASGRDRGAGIRVVVGETTGFAHTADLSPTGLRAASAAASAAALGGGDGVREVVLDSPSGPPSAVVDVLPSDVAKDRKVALLAEANEAARARDGAITQVTAR